MIASDSALTRPTAARLSPGLVVAVLAAALLAVLCALGIGIGLGAATYPPADAGAVGQRAPLSPQDSSAWRPRAAFASPLISDRRQTDDS